MGLLRAFYPHAIRIPAVAPTAATDICHLDEISPRYNDQEISEACASSFGPDFIGLSFSSPDMTFNTGEIKKVLTVTTDENLARDFTAGLVDLEYKAAKPLGTRELDATAAHLRGRITNAAMVYWNSIDLPQGRFGRINTTLVTAWDGVASDPLIWTKGQAIGATSLSITDLYTFGGVRINGAAINGVTNANWNNRVELETIASDGEEYNTYHSIKMIAPEIVIQTNNAEVMADYGQRGVALDDINGIVLYARRYKARDLLYPVGDAEHIALTGLSGYVRARQISGSPAVCEVSIRLQKDGSGNFFTTNLASTIT